MGTLKLFSGLVLISGISLITSCSGGSETKVTVSLSNKYPEITLAFPVGKILSIVSPDNSTGSIGYISGGETKWITGLPDQSKPAERTVALTWNIEGEEDIILTIEMISVDFRLSLSQTGHEGDEITGWIVNFSASPDEHFTGIFERVVDGHQNNSWAEGIEAALNLRGQKVDVRLKPTVSGYSPFYISSGNYGFFAEGTWPGVIDFCSAYQETVSIAFEGPAFSFRIYTADNPMDIVQRHALETGPSFMPPDWAFGPWRWRDEHSNKPVYYDGTPVRAPYNTDLVEDVLMMQAFDIPFTAFWIDRPWATGPNGYDDYEWDTSRFPDPEGMIRWLNGKNAELMLWIAPFVMGEMADYAEQNNYHLISKLHSSLERRETW